MYRQLEPHVREFALATLTAAIRFDIRVALASRYISIGVGSLYRSDVLIYGLVGLMGSTLEETRSDAIEAYFGAIKNVVEPDKAKRPKRPTSAEQLYVEMAAAFLCLLEDLVHAEGKGTLSERAKRRLQDRLRCVKGSVGVEPPVPVPGEVPPPPPVEPGENAVLPQGVLAPAEEPVPVDEDAPDEAFDEAPVPYAPVPAPARRPAPARPVNPGLAALLERAGGNTARLEQAIGDPQPQRQQP